MLALLLLLVLPLLAARAAVELRYFRIGTAATTGTYFQIGGVLASAITNPPGSRDCDHGGSCGVPGLVAVAEATQGSIDNVLAVGSGKLESALVQADVAYWAFSGQGLPAAPRCRVQTEPASQAIGTALLKISGALPDLRVIAALYPEDIHVVVRDESQFQQLRDLKGARVAMGEPGSGTLADARLVLEAAGLSECDLKPTYLRLSQAAAALAANEIDAFFLVAGPPVPAVVDVASTVKIRLLPIDGPVLDRLTQKYPFFLADTVPAGAYPGIDTAVPTVSVTAQWIGNAKLDDDLVYAVTKALWQQSTRRLLETSHPAGQRIRLDAALKGVVVSLHPGAERFYREAGLTIPALPQ